MAVMRQRKFASAKFCPFCGTETLIRDEYRSEGETDSKAAHYGRSAYPEWICSICNVGFKLSPSRRHEHALALFKEHRKMRPGKG